LQLVKVEIKTNFQWRRSGRPTRIRLHRLPC
jgi:hypothetical protein